MKKLFFLLLVVNLVIWLWGQREELRRATGTAPPDFGAIRVVDEAELAARREQGATQPQVASSVAAGPADIEARVETEPAAPVRTAAAEQPLVEGQAAAPPAAEATLPLSDQPTATAAATASTDFVAEPTPPAVPPTPSSPTPVDDEAGATAFDAGPRSAEPGEAVSSEVPAATTIEAEPAHATEPTIASTGVPDQPTSAEVGAAVAEPSAPGPEPAAVPVESVTAKTPEPPVDSTPSVPAAEVAASTPEVATMAQDLAAKESAVPEKPVAVEGAPIELAPSEEAPAAPPAQAEAIAPAEAAAPGAPAVATESVSEPREVLYLCESLGPFRDRAAAERIGESLQAPLRAVELREERIARTSRYWVLAPAQPDRQALADYIGRLEQAGVRDAWRIPSGPFAGRLAVGVFQAAANARKHADMLEARGVAAEIHAPKDEERRYWIDYERPADADAPERAGERSRPAPQIVPRDCGRVAGP